MNIYIKVFVPGQEQLAIRLHTYNRCLSQQSAVVDGPCKKNCSNMLRNKRRSVSQLISLLTGFLGVYLFIYGVIINMRLDPHTKVHLLWRRQKYTSAVTPAVIGQDQFSFMYAEDLEEENRHVNKLKATQQSVYFKKTTRTGSSTVSSILISYAVRHTIPVLYHSTGTYAH